MLKQAGRKEGKSQSSAPRASGLLAKSFRPACQELSLEREELSLERQELSLERQELGGSANAGEVAVRVWLSQAVHRFLDKMIKTY